MVIGCLTGRELGQRWVVGGAKYENVHSCAQNTPALQAKFQQELKFSTQSTLCCSQERMQQGANILDKLVQPSFFLFSQNSTEKMQNCISFAELFFVLYSTTDRTSFEEASLVARYILQDKSLTSGATVMIVATKCDLEHLREVEEKEGRLLAKDLNCEFYQVSNSEGYLETQELLYESLQRCLNKNKSSPLTRVKEGLVETAKSFRKRSFNHEVTTADRERPRSMRSSSFSDVDSIPESPRQPRGKSSSQEDLAQEEKNHRNSVASTASF